MNPKKFEINWIVIPAPELEKSSLFYSKVFGWEISKYNEDYLIFKAGNMSGGLDKKKKVAEGGICFSITVDEINKMFKKIQKCGGRVKKEKTEIGSGFGFYGSFIDPNGNEIELWSEK